MAPADDVEYWKNVFTIIGTLVAIVGLGKALYEYTRQIAEKRAQQFFELRTSYRQNERFMRIINQLYKPGGGDFTNIPESDRIEFMGFFEEVAFLLNSKMMREEVASYMFGADAIVAWTNDKFWSRENRENVYWSLLKAFVERMQAMEKHMPYEPDSLKL